jgi:endo-1,4-beta-xylanase
MTTASFPLRAQTRTLLRAAALSLLVPLFLPSAARADDPATLKEAYGSKFAVGASIPGPGLTVAEKALLVANFTNVTPENCMKPEATEPQEGHFTFDQADRFVAFARDNGLKVNGHCLVWGQQTPDWFFLDNGKPAGRDLVLKRMTDHIAGEVGHFKGQVASWDVVNEAIDDGGGYLKSTPWLKSIGEDYVAQAFAAAAAADPQAELYYNDYNIETPGKRAKVLRLIRDLKAQNIRIDGVGIQGHWELDHIPFKDIEDAIAAFQAEGLKVMFTELDLDVVPRLGRGADLSDHEGGADPYANGCPPEVLQKQADQYGRLFALFNRHADAISRVTFWGLDDSRSWLNGWPWKRTNYPLLWDRNAAPKPALAAVLKASQ